MEGFDALADQRAGKRTLRTHAVKPKPVPEIRADEVTKVREEMKLSRSLFARYLRTNVRKIGQPMPVEDSYIAAIAIRHNLTVVTGNEKDFRRPGIKLLNPFDEAGSAD